MRDHHERQPGSRGAEGGVRAREGADGAGPDRRTARRALLGLAVLALVAVVTVVVLDFLQLSEALDHPEPGNGFSDWQCSGQTRTCRP